MKASIRRLEIQPLTPVVAWQVDVTLKSRRRITWVKADGRADAELIGAQN